MNASKTMLTGLVTGLMLAGGALAQTPPTIGAQASSGAVAANPEKTRAEYNAIAAHLDPGGDLMVVANTDGLIEEMGDYLRSFAQMIPTTSDGKPFVDALNRLPAFLKSSGLYAVDGFGMSVVPRADGLNDIKEFVYRDPAAAQLPFWQGLIGGAPKRLNTLDYLPADTVLVRAGTADPRQLWKFIGDAVRQVGGPEAVKAFDDGVNAAGKSIGTNLNSVIASLDAEQFFSMQLSSTQTVQLPGEDPGQTLTIPVPSLLVGSAVRDATLVTTIRRALQQAQLPVMTTTNGATKLYTVSLPLPLPFPVMPTFAMHRGMFLFGSTPEIVRSAIAGAEAPGGARLPAAFQKAFEGLPKQNNGFAFMDRRFSDTLAKVQMHFFKASHGGEEMAGMMQMMLQRQQPGQLTAVLVNEKDGVAVRGTTSMNGRQLVLGAAVAPVAIVAAIAVPSLIRSRDMARSMHNKNYNTEDDTAPGARTGRPGMARPAAGSTAKCINNLRLIDHAKQQWATEKNKTDIDTPADKELLKYFKDGRLPVCPDGGIYIINAVGELPICTKPGHKLQE